MKATKKISFMYLHMSVPHQREFLQHQPHAGVLGNVGAAKLALNGAKEALTFLHDHTTIRGY